MIISIPNPFSLLRRKPASVPNYSHAESLATLKTLVATQSNNEVQMATPNKFISVLEAIGKGFEKGLSFAVTYAVPVEKLVAILFPSAAPAVAGVAEATGLIQNAVLLVEQRYGAAGKQSGTGAQKLADALTLVQPTVISLLKQAGVNADPGYVEGLVKAVVAVLNVQTAPATAVAA